MGIRQIGMQILLSQTDNVMLKGFKAILFDELQICLTSVFRKIFILIVDGKALDEIYENNLKVQ